MRNRRKRKMVEVDVHRVRGVTTRRLKFKEAGPGAHAFDVVYLHVESEDDELTLRLYLEAGAKVGLADED